MTFEIIFVLIVISSMFIFLVFDATKPEFIMFIAVSILLIAGIISTEDALKGFSSEAMLTVAILFIVAGAVQQSGVMSAIINIALGKVINPRFSLIRMMLPVIFLSAFLNNTPIVVMFSTIIKQWCERNNIAPSKFLIPLSYAAIFGGTLTLIGTSTNLIIHDFMQGQGLIGLTMFQLAIVGLPTCLIGTLYIFLIYDWLPDRKKEDIKLEKNKERKFLCEATIEINSPLIGKSAHEAGLGDLQELTLIKIKNGKYKFLPISSNTKLKERDCLMFTADLLTIFKLQQLQGFKLETGSRVNFGELKKDNAYLIEVIVSFNSPLVEKTVTESNFCDEYGAEIIAIHRNYKRVEGKIGDIILNSGDIILLTSDCKFIKRWQNSGHFYVLSSYTKNDLEEMSLKNSIIAISSFIIMIFLAVFTTISMFKSAVIATVILFILKVIDFTTIRKYVHLNVLLLIVSSIGVGTALEVSGTADYIAELFFSRNTSLLVTLIFIYLLTTLFTEVITNNAAAMLMLPIASAVSNQINQDPLGFYLTIAIAASASFATPIGYQTNLLVYAMGNYRFFDYVYIGAPLNILYMVVTVPIIYFNYY